MKHFVESVAAWLGLRARRHLQKNVYEETQAGPATERASADDCKQERCAREAATGVR